MTRCTKIVHQLLWDHNEMPHGKTARQAGRQAV